MNFSKVIKLGDNSAFSLLICNVRYKHVCCMKTKESNFDYD